MQKWNQELVKQNRKICFLMDNFSAHKAKCSYIEFVFLPPNCTSIIQPLDQGIIKMAKDRAKMLIASKFLSHIHSVPPAIPLGFPLPQPQKTPERPLAATSSISTQAITPLHPALVKESSTPKGQIGDARLKNFFASGQQPTVKRKCDPKDVSETTPKKYQLNIGSPKDKKATYMTFSKTPLSPTPSTTSTMILDRIPKMETLSVPVPDHVPNKLQEEDEV